MADLTSIEILSHLTALRAQVSGLHSALIARPDHTPPATETLSVSLGEPVLDLVDSWRTRQLDVPTRSVAVERMVEAFLDLDAWTRDREEDLP
ncbi:hypothetical protein HLH34_02675 [Gluconacetobacter azotocaptans]|uniref:Uncharacterized protein n=1 Tax=Gluconacetobacter azotocaptans TaxID=142834 RepID=A0A7W4JQ46_9PROT|nr:hypothetical protein [Gluconacetobacter azotocaptans]MBB2188867.1 hypothetical protein [Gluconacetobacter azotocaptans]MBM9401636.1 hypothetical protein [Gluconacetobacter azotocaptans]GBQ28746.1 hypothetical protein AA13594_1101 [Gluconacetobacter azotocaptans DSM 13594]